MSILDGNSPVQQPAPQVVQQPEQQVVTQQQVAPVASVLDGPQAAGNVQQQPAGGFLNELGLNWDAVPTTNNPSDGTHRCFVTKSEIKTKQADQSKSWVITYRVADGEKEQGRTNDEWRPIPNVQNGNFVTEKDETNARWLKQRLMSLGVPETRVGSTSPKDLLGIECYVTFKTNTTSKGSFQNVVNVKLASEVNAQMGGIAQPAAQQMVI